MFSKDGLDAVREFLLLENDPARVRGAKRCIGVLAGFLMVRESKLERGEGATHWNGACSAMSGLAFISFSYGPITHSFRRCVQ